MIATLILAAAAPLHFTVNWETAEVRAGDEVVARVFCSSASGVDESLMTEAQRAQRADVLRRIDSTWEGEARKGRLRLSLALSKANDSAPNAGVHSHGCRFLFPDGTIVRTDFLLSFPSGSQAVVVEDIGSGQYLAVEKVGKPSDLAVLFHTAFSDGPAAPKDAAAKDALWRKIAEESERAAAKTRAVAEVNGQRALLAEGASDDEIGAALAGMWCNLDGEPRTRIERVLGVLAVVRAMMGKETDFRTMAVGAHLPASALRFNGVPVVEAPTGTRLVRTSNPHDGLMALQPPPEDVAKPFYGERGWWTLDFSASFPSQVERLLRGDRP